jgi:protein tyrosine phosphatase (PTP) superfamily phosphohydrolase (DUF442 family)
MNGNTNNTLVISNDLDLAQLSDCREFTFEKVIDLRHTNDGTACGMEENIMKRMANIWVEYSQVPTDIRVIAMQDTRDMLERVRPTTGKVMVLTDQISEMVSFCFRHGIQFRCMDSKSAEQSADIIPVDFDAQAESSPDMEAALA